jgi:hypothetical protein
MFQGIYTEEERKELIVKEFTKLKKSLKEIDESRKLTIEKLLQEAAFMTVTLEETRQIITRDGIIEEYQNGATQKGLKKSSAVEVYDKLLTSYARVVEQINKSLPEPIPPDVSDNIMTFAFGKKK